MTGRILCTEESGKGKLYQETICGLPFAVQILSVPAGLSEKRLEKRLARIERKFRELQVDRVILPRNFFWTDKLRCLQQIEVLPFYRAAAHLMVIYLLEERGCSVSKARVALSASRLGPEVRRTACSLCGRVKEVKLDIPGREGAAFARELQQRFGVPVVPLSAHADIAVSFCDMPGDLVFSEQRLELCGLTIKGNGLELPADFELQVLALLWERGRLEEGRIKVVREA